MFTTYGAIRSAGEREGYGELELLVSRDIYIHSFDHGVDRNEYARIVETDATQYVNMINRHWEKRLTK
jgi:hypothetical protein